MVYSPHPVRVGKEPRHLAVTTQRRRGDITVTLTKDRAAKGAAPDTDATCTRAYPP